MAATPPTVDDFLLQYGAVGAMALIFGYVAIRLYNQLQSARKEDIARIEAAHKAAMDRADAALAAANARADRMESEVRDVNKLITGQLAEVLVRANDVVGRVLNTTTTEH